LKYKKTFNNIKNETEWDMSNIDTSENDNRAPNYELSVKFIENLVDEEGDILRENQNQNFVFKCKFYFSTLRFEIIINDAIINCHFSSICSIEFLDDDLSLQISLYNKPKRKNQNLNDQCLNKL